jgi:DNA-binding GntR family transcriptional regulator
MESDTPSSIQREQAYRSLRRLLVLQQLPAGQRLREPEWATRLNVHRTALREAFARLEAEGLIDRGAQTGYFVPVLTDEDLIEITKLRLALETLAVDEICARAEASASLSKRLSPLGIACDELEQFIRGGYSLGVVEADRRFHEALIDAAGSRRLSMLYNRAPLPLVHSHMEEPDAWQETCRDTVAEHRQIIAALSRGDAAQARLLLREHVTKRSLVPTCR